MWGDPNALVKTLIMCVLIGLYRGYVFQFCLCLSVFVSVFVRGNLDVNKSHGDPYFLFSIWEEEQILRTLTEGIFLIRSKLLSERIFHFFKAFSRGSSVILSPRMRIL